MWAPTTAQFPWSWHPELSSLQRKIGWGQTVMSSTLSRSSSTFALSHSFLPWATFSTLRHNFSNLLTSLPSLIVTGGQNLALDYCHGAMTKGAACRMRSYTYTFPFSSSMIKIVFWWLLSTWVPHLHWALYQAPQNPATLTLTGFESLILPWKTPLTTFHPLFNLKITILVCKRRYCIALPSQTETFSLFRIKGSRSSLPLTPAIPLHSLLC